MKEISATMQRFYEKMKGQQNQTSAKITKSLAQIVETPVVVGMMAEMVVTDANSGNSGSGRDRGGEVGH